FVFWRNPQTTFSIAHLSPRASTRNRDATNEHAARVHALARFASSRGMIFFGWRENLAAVATVARASERRVTRAEHEPGARAGFSSRIFSRYGGPRQPTP